MNRVWFLGCHGGDFYTHATFKRRAMCKWNSAHVERVPRVLERRGSAFFALHDPPLSNELINGGHR